MNWNDFKGVHAGEKMIVVGLSPYSVYEFCGLGYRTIGVNDIGKYYPTDYTVIVDPKECFTDDRWKKITESKSRVVFSQLDIPHPRLCKIKLNERPGSFLECDDVIDISRTSTFVACNIAALMGAKKIGLTGQDHLDTNHSLNKSVEIILDHLRALKVNLDKRGVELVSISATSRINEVIPYEPAENF